MDTFLTIISFPFWGIGLFLLSFAIWPWTKITVEGRRVYGSNALAIRIVMILLAAAFLIPAYGLTVVAN